MTRPENTISTRIMGVDIQLETAPSLFSPRRIDPGTLAMLSCVDFSPDDKVLDLGCGYGVVGIVAAKLVGPTRVFMTDNDPKAIELSGRNAERNGVGQIGIARSDGFDDFHEAHFTKILCNPPYHVDFSVAKNFIHKAFNRLALNGRMIMVTKRRKWYENKLRGIFGSVQVRESGGYCVFLAQKKSFTWAKRETKQGKASANKKSGSAR